MNPNVTSSTAVLIDRLAESMNRHDLDALADCFQPNYDSEFPAHPERSFQGQERMRVNWSRIFAAVPDLTAVVVRSASNQETAWAEWHWTGTRSDGEPFDMRGVTIQQIRDGKIAWARLYMEPVERAADRGEADMRQLLSEKQSQS